MDRNPLPLFSRKCKRKREGEVDEVVVRSCRFLWEESDIKLEATDVDLLSPTCYRRALKTNAQKTARRDPMVVSTQVR